MQGNVNYNIIDEMESNMSHPHKMPYFPEYGREVMSDVVRIAIYDGQHVNTEVVFR